MWVAYFQYITKFNQIIFSEEKRLNMKREITCETFNNLVSQVTQKNAFSDLKIEVESPLKTLWPIYRTIMCQVTDNIFFNKHGTVATLSKLCLENCFN